MTHDEQIEMALAIIEKTNDGDDLDAADLKLVEGATNGRLTEAGNQALARLHQTVLSPQGYKRPWFYGIEHLIKDDIGYVYWKGKIVDHYSFTDAVREKESAEELARKCRRLEELGVAVSINAQLSLKEK